MSKKDFIALAKGIKQIPDMESRKIAAERVAEVCRSKNPRFDNNRFFNACEVTE